MKTLTWKLPEAKVSRVETFTGVTTGLYGVLLRTFNLCFKELKLKMGRTGVRIGVAGVMLFIPTCSASMGLGRSAGLRGEGGYLLPWHVIVEKIRTHNRFCSAAGAYKVSRLRDPKVSASGNCCYEPGQTITINLPAGAEINSSLRRIEIDVAKWTEDSWLPVNRISARVEPGGKELVWRLEDEGFFRLRYRVGTRDGQPLNFESYAIVSADWKKDILAFCRTLKNEIEANPDMELYRCSIAVSHFDHTMELVIDASFASVDILKALADSVDAKAAFDSGLCPDFVLGLNKIKLRRFPGGPITEFALLIPSDYDSSRQWPVLVDVEGRYRDHGNGVIGLSWYDVSYKKIPWKEYKRFLGIVKAKLNIDEDRIYLYGKWCAGISAMALALKHPDEWAECSTLIGNSYRHLTGNALNLPFIFVQDEYHSTARITGYCDFAARCFQYYGCAAFKTSKLQTTEELRGTPVPEAARERSPERVLYTVESLAEPRAYWVKVEGRANENFPGTIDAHVREGTIFVRTSNVDAYSLDLAQAPIDESRPIEIVENGKSVGSVTTTIFTKRSEKYANATYVKTEHLHGPVWDALTEPYVVVYGTSGTSKEVTEIGRRAAKSLAGAGPSFADSNLPEELVTTHNLILVGTVQSNLWLSKIAADLPVQINGRQIFADGKCYDSDNTGLILIYPNPISPQKYVLVFSGTSLAAVTNISKAFTRMQSERPADIGIFKIDEQDDIKWEMLEKFSTVWDWHDESSYVLAETSRRHSKKQWSRWVARALKEQFEADAAICEDQFKFSEPPPAGQITYRDLFNSFRNTWLVKIRISGRSIKHLLTLPFGDISKRELAEIVVDGVSLVTREEDFGGQVLAIGDLENEKKYTVALPYQVINGNRMGMAVEDYEIIGDGWLVPLLKDYLCENRSLDIDAQLDCHRSDVF